METVVPTMDSEVNEAPPPERDAKPAPPTATKIGPAPPPPRRRNPGRRSQRTGKRRTLADNKRRGQKPQKRRGQQEEKREGVTVKTAWSGGKRRWDKKHYCVFCRRPQVKIARHMLRKHAEEQEVAAASVLPPGSKQRQLLLEHLRCRGNYLHNIEVIRQGSGEIVPWRQPSEEVDARNYLPCPLCLGFFLRADLWKHQVTCRKKLSEAPPTEATPTEADPASESTGRSGEESADEVAPEETPAKDPADPADPQPGSKRPLTSDPAAPEQNAAPPRKRVRVQAAASRLLPISSGASESCSEILHRMNLDNVSHQVKSDWLICKYGNKLMGSQDGGGGGGVKRYDYVSQKLRELGRLLLAARSLDREVRTLQDLLVPGRLRLALAAARKASGYRWTRPPLALKTTLRTVCEVAIGESLQDGDWETAATTTDLYHRLGRDWDHLGLQDQDQQDQQDQEPDTAGGREKVKKRADQSRNDKDLRPEGPLKTSRPPVPPVPPVPPESRLQAPVSVPMAPKKVQRRPWSSAEKEAVWRQLGVHVLVQTVPGKEVCQRCLDLEPVLRGRHWKDIKNQVHNQIQSQKKQQFHAQMDLQENQEGPDQNQDQDQNQKKQLQVDQQDKNHIQNQKKPQYQPLMDQLHQDQNQKRQQYQIQMTHQDQNQKKLLQNPQLDHQNPLNPQLDHQNPQLDHQNHQNPQLDHQNPQLDHQNPHQNHLQLHKKQLCHPGLDHQDHQDHQNHQNHQDQDHKKQLYQMDPQPLQVLDRDQSLLAPFGPDGSHRGPGLPLLEREPGLGPYHRTSGPHMDLLSRAQWTQDSLNQNYGLTRQLGRSLLQDSSGGAEPDPHAHVHF